MVSNKSAPPHPRKQEKKEEMRKEHPSSIMKNKHEFVYAEVNPDTVMTRVQ